MIRTRSAWKPSRSDASQSLARGALGWRRTGDPSITLSNCSPSLCTKPANRIVEKNQSFEQHRIDEMHHLEWIHARRGGKKFPKSFAQWSAATTGSRIAQCLRMTRVLLVEDSADVL